MTVYVDPARYPYGRMIMCHMIADTEEELHDMADRIGVRQVHFQDGARPHYDICKTKRAQAVRLGAQEVSSKELVRRLREAQVDGAFHRAG